MVPCSCDRDRQLVVMLSNDTYYRIATNFWHPPHEASFLFLPAAPKLKILSLIHPPAPEKEETKKTQCIIYNNNSNIDYSSMIAINDYEMNHGRNKQVPVSLVSPPDTKNKRRLVA